MKKEPMIHSPRKIAFDLLLMTINNLAQKYRIAHEPDTFYMGFYTAIVI
ncbi:hypothetical protein SAMN05660206_11036 [Sphingobacterium wenxiniae]|uniref:Uncharacterized protein n=1 Tax=Sphingobacterium wenxiniae TaxID=683125 RepID=A0A1I6UU19_9SPHI|nr:hypothetical protein SAMN05660206_11036 [Sphingobacterium wenxiniae]